jgi:Asp-tRNA(Asn)/Glu-tRNA(Gln) amidotransferase A subunit family amidase
MSDMGHGFDRRRFTAFFAGFGLAGTALPRLLWAEVEATGIVSKEVLQSAEALAGLEFTDPERELMIKGLEELREDYNRLREVALGNDVAPALSFDPVLPGMEIYSRPLIRRRSRPLLSEPPGNESELAFLPVTELSHLVRTKAVSSEELTLLFLDRLERFDPQLHCVITLTRERALRQARRADNELAAGTWRGPLHGIPWGAKDLLAVRGYPTTWGAEPFRDQVVDEDATVVQKLDAAGAVLVAKLTLGALAWGDVWFGERTRNPWNLEDGSSGSSAGPGSATAAGLVGFSIGSETWGSIVSPSTRCGVTGLRPTFGRVSRHGAMALSWSMDKLGPMCRSVEDCALVFDAIHGAEGVDSTAVERPFVWDAELDFRSLRVGYLKSFFEKEPEFDEDDDEEDRAAAREWHALDLEALDVLRALGMDLIPMELPDLPVSALSFILSAEAGAAFDELTRSGRDDLLVRQIENAWPNVFRQARTIPAVEYIQANRVRTLLMREMEKTLDGIDLWIAPSFGGSNLLLTNLTGHPAVVLPNGFRSNGTPTSITVNGRLFGESEILAVARAYQEATGFHRQHPEMFVTR